MHIASVKAAFPSLKVSNQDVLSRVEAASRPVFQGDLKRALKQIDLLFELSGSNLRYWVQSKEEHLELIRDTVNAALDQAAIDTKSAGMVIHAGVDRVFAEPGDAYFIAKVTGLNQAHCMDIADACNSYSRALHVAQAFLTQKLYPWVLIVNTECKMGRMLIDNALALNLNHIEELTWKYATMTIGDCVAATVLTPSATPVRFEIDSKPEYAHLCAVPQRRFSGYEALLRPEVEALSQQYQLDPQTIFERGIFVCFSKDLEAEGLRHGAAPLRRLGLPLEAYDIMLPHTTATGPWAQAAKTYNLKDKLFNIYPDRGNVVSASIPAGLAEAYRLGRLRRGQKVLCWTAAAGMSFFAYTFDF